MGNLDGDGLLVVSSMAGACRCECHLQPQSQLKSGLRSACGMLPGTSGLASMGTDTTADMVVCNCAALQLENSMHVVYLSLHRCEETAAVE